jgi:outer membrane protein TolC
MLRVRDQIARLPGVSQFWALGERQYAMRIWIDPDKAAVENALSMLAQTEAYVTQLQAQVQSLTSARDLSQMAYRAGSITLTDVLDADRQLLVAQDELDANRAGAARAAVVVFRSFGGGWDPPK